MSGARDWIISVMETLSYWGIALLMFLENIVPPIPSEVVMPFAGFTAKQGDLSLWGAIVAGTLGSLLGTTAWYGLAWLVGTERLKDWADNYGRWLGIRRGDIEKADRWFDEWGHWAILVGRMIPGIRTLISIPAGFSEMPFTRFLLYTLIGTGAWTALLAGLGYMLGENWKSIEQYVGWISLAVVATLLVAAVIWIWRRRRAVMSRAT